MTRRIRHYAQDRAGFSFVELMIVIAMIGVLSAMAAPSVLRGLPEKRLKNAARNLYADLQRARLRAVRENRNISVIFVPTVGKEGTGKSSRVSYFFDINNDGIRNTDLPDPEFGKVLVSSLGETGYDDVHYGCGDVIDWNGNTAPDSGITGNIVFTKIGSISNSIPVNESIIFLGRDDVNSCYAVSVSRFGSVKIKWQRGESNLWD